MSELFRFMSIRQPHSVSPSLFKRVDSGEGPLRKVLYDPSLSKSERVETAVSHLESREDVPAMDVAWADDDAALDGAKEALKDEPDLPSYLRRLEDAFLARIFLVQLGDLDPSKAHTDRYARAIGLTEAVESGKEARPVSYRRFPRSRAEATSRARSSRAVHTELRALLKAAMRFRPSVRSGVVRTPTEARRDWRVRPVRLGSISSATSQFLTANGVNPRQEADARQLVRDLYRLLDESAELWRSR